MFSRFVLISALIVGSLSQTNLGDTSFNGVKCCDPSRGSCTPGLPLCSDLMTASTASTAAMTPSPTTAFRDTGCCDPSKMQCTSSMPICPSPSPSPYKCCDPTTMNCASDSFICPSASMTSAPTPRPTQSPTMSAKLTYNNTCCDPATMATMNCAAVICPSVSMTSAPSQRPTISPTATAKLSSNSSSGSTGCCDPARMNCVPGSFICPSASMTSAPTPRPSFSSLPSSLQSMSSLPSKRPIDCCDPMKMDCPTGAPICASASMTSRSQIPSDACCDPAKFPCPDFVPLCPPGSGTSLPSIPPDACCDSQIMMCPSFVPICKPSASITARPSFPKSDCCDPTLIDCPSDAPICDKPSQSMTSKPTQRLPLPLPLFSLSASFTSKPTPRPIPSSLTLCCDPVRFQCLLGMPLCKSSPLPLSSAGAITPRPIDDGICCDPMTARCDSTVRICPSQRPLFSAKPSPILAYPTQFISVLRDIMNNAASAARPSPSPWVIRNPVNLTALGLPRPEAITSRLSFTGGANLTDMMRPAKLQELLVQLACTFRMPLENIRITNITYYDALLAKLQTIPFDPAIVNLNSNGTVVCMPARLELGGRVLRGRGLQTGSGSSNINVDYAILDPSDNILSLDDAELSSVLASSSLNDFQASIGAAAPIASTPAPTAATTPDDASIRVGLGVGLGVTGFVAVAAIGALIIRRRKQPRRLTSSSVHVVYANTTNPINNGEAFNLRVVSDRHQFNPIGSRV